MWLFFFFFSRRRPASAFVSLAHLRDRRRPSSPFNFSSPLLPTDTHTARHLAERHAGIAVPAAATETASLSPSARRAPSFSAALQRNRRDAATFLFFLLPCAKGLLLSITCHLILARQLTRSLASAQAKHVRPAPRGANAGAFSQQPLATCKKSKCLEPKHVTFFAVVPHRACAPPPLPPAGNLAQAAKALRDLCTKPCGRKHFATRWGCRFHAVVEFRRHVVMITVVIGPFRDQSRFRSAERPPSVLSGQDKRLFSD